MVKEKHNFCRLLDASCSFVHLWDGINQGDPGGIFCIDGTTQTKEESTVQDKIPITDAPASPPAEVITERDTATEDVIGDKGDFFDRFLSDTRQYA